MGTFDFLLSKDSLLKKALENSDVKKVIELIDSGANINTIADNGKSAIWLAVEKNNMELLNKLLAKKYINVEFCFKGELPLIGFACSNGNLDIVKSLLSSKKIDVNARANNGFTALAFAIEAGDLDMVQLLFNAGAFKNKPILGTTTPLVFAIIKGQTEIAKYLLEQNVNFKTSEISQLSAINAAITHKDTEIILQLLNKGVDINEKGPTGGTYLMNAVLTSEDNAEVIKVLLDRGADVNAQDAEGNTALSFAFKYKKPSIVELLLKNGADPNLTYGNERKTLLMESVDNDEMFQILFSHGADVSIQSINGETALSLAIIKENINCVRLLLDSTGQKDEAMLDGITPLMLSASKGKTEIMKLLLDRGVDINGKDYKGYNALFFAVSGGNLKSVELLINNGIEINEKDNNGFTCLMFASQSGNLAIASLLLASGAEMAIEESTNGLTALTIALIEDYPEVAEVFIKNGYDLQNYVGEQALLISIKKGYFDLIKILLENGVNPNAKDTKGNFALQIACYEEDDNPIFWLLKYGANINAQNNYGETALMVAVSKEYIKGVIILIEHGADLDIKRANGDTAIELAVGRQNFKIVDLLLEAGANDMKLKQIWKSNTGQNISSNELKRVMKQEANK